MTRILSLTHPEWIFFYEAGLQSENAASGVATHAEVFQTLVNTGGPPGLIICDYDHVPALSTIVRKNPVLEGTPTILVSEGRDEGLALKNCYEQGLNILHVIKMTDQKPRVLSRIARAFASATKDAGAGVVTQEIFMDALAFTPLQPLERRADLYEGTLEAN